MKNGTPRKTINVDKPNRQTIYGFKELDNAVLRLSLYKNSIPFDVEGQTIRLGAKTSKGIIEQVDGFTINANELDIELKNSILVPGVVEIDLELKDANGIMTTASFFITVESRVLNDTAVQSTNEFDTFSKTVAKVEEDYNSLRRIIIDENQAANLQDQVNKTNAQLENKANKVDVVKRGNVDLDEMTERTLKAIQGGDGANFEILSIPRDYSTTPKKTTFFDISNDYNLFDKNNVMTTSYVGSDGNVVVSESETYKNYVTSNLINVNSENIIITGIKAWAIALYKDDVFLVRYTSTSVPINTPISLLYNEQKANKVRITFNTTSSTGDYNLAMVCEGEEIKDYMPFGGIAKIKNENIDLDYLKSNLLEKQEKIYEPLLTPRGIRLSAWRGCTYIKKEGETWFTAYAPQNSIPAFKKACELKFDFLWLAGIQISLDNEFYIVHDNNLLTWTGDNINVSQTNSNVLDTLKLLNKTEYIYSDEELKIPKFEDVIKISLNGKTPMGIRLSRLPSDIEGSNKTIWDKFINLCEKYGLENCIYSGSEPQVEILNSYHNDWHIQITGSSTGTIENTISQIDYLVSKNYKRKSLIAYKNALSSDVMSYARKNDVYVFAVGEEPTTKGEIVEFYKDICPDGIITHNFIELI